MPDISAEVATSAEPAECDYTCQLERALGEDIETTPELKSGSQDYGSDFSSSADDSLDLELIDHPEVSTTQQKPSSGWKLPDFLGPLGFGSLSSIKKLCGDSEYQPNQEPQSSTYKMLKGIIKGSEDPSARNNNFFQGALDYVNNVFSYMLSQPKEDKKNYIKPISTVTKAPEHKPSYECSQLGTVAEYLACSIGNLDCCREDCSPFTDKWHVDKNAVSSLFENLTSVSENHGYGAMSNDRETLANIVKDLMSILKTKDLYNKYMIKRGIMYAISTRPDCEDVNLNAAHIFPQLIATCNVFPDESEDGAMDYAGETWNEVSTFTRVEGNERLLDYFREDDNLHRFHSSWHSNNHVRGSSTMRERFWYMHSQMMARYRIERRVAGVSGVQPLNSRSGTFSSYYNVRAGNDQRLRSFSSNRRTCRLRSGSNNNLNRQKSQLAANRRRGRSIERFAGEVERGYHVTGHSNTGAQCAVGGSRGIMVSPVVSARDPLFYRWHWEVDLIFQTFLRTLGSHSRQAVAPPTGVKVEDVNMASCNRHNVVHTFWERYRGNTYRLNHQSYSLNIRLSNASGSRGKVIIRVFLFLESALSWYPIELDKFVYTLRGQQSETVTRRDTDSSLSEKGRDDCGWPRNLALPKGSLGGTHFRLVAMVNNPTSQRVSIGESTQYSQVLCGRNSWDRGMVEDGRIQGFPFSQNWWSNNEKLRVIRNQNSDFGNVAKVVTIVHRGIGSRGNCS